MANKRAIVTGANGFIGSHLVAELLKNNYYVVALVHSSSDRLPKDERCRILKLADVDSQKQCIEEGADFFFNLLWAGVDTGGRGSMEIQLNNIDSSLKMVELASRLKVKKFIGVGSVMEIESMKNLDSNTAVPTMAHIYGGAKIATAIFSKSLAIKKNMKFNWVRLTNAFGPGEISNRLICYALKSCLLNQTPKFTEGDQLYDFIYIEDAVRGLRLIAEEGKNLKTYLLGSGAPQPLKNYLIQIQQLVAPNLFFDLGFYKYNCESLTYSDLDASELSKDCKFTTNYDFKDGILNTFNWLRSQKIS